MRPLRTLFVALLVSTLSPTAAADCQPQPGRVAAASSPIDDLFAGTLYVGGGGGLPDEVFESFARAAGGRDQRLVVIPTASARADSEEGRARILNSWREDGWTEVELLHTRDREIADSDEFVQQLSGARAVWLGGGDQNRLSAAYRGTKTLEALQAFLAGGGVVGGSSAGAAIVSDPMIGGGRDEPRIVPGFGLLSGVLVDQHFTERNRIGRLRKAVSDADGRVGIGIDEGTCLVVRGRSLQVLGRGSVTVLDGGEERVVESGRSLDLVQLRRAALDTGTLQIAPLRGPENGTLVIVGGGAVPEGVLRRFVESAGGSESRIVIVPTALADGRARAARGAERQLRAAGAEQVSVFDIVDRSKLAGGPESEVLEPLTQATGIWFTGGRQWRLVDAYEGTVVEELFSAVLERGGAIGGSSAGASIQAEVLVRGHPLTNQIMEARGYRRGFGYLRGAAVDQHFTERQRLPDLRSVIEDHAGLVGFGIDEGTALVVEGDRFEVLGRGRVSVLRQTAQDEVDPELAAGAQVPVEVLVEVLEAGDVRSAEQLEAPR